MKRKIKYSIIISFITSCLLLYFRIQHNAQGEIYLFDEQGNIIGIDYTFLLKVFFLGMLIVMPIFLIIFIIIGKVKLWLTCRIRKK